jgi:hypothetical protein
MRRKGRGREGVFDCRGGTGFPVVDMATPLSKKAESLKVALSLCYFSFVLRITFDLSRSGLPLHFFVFVFYFSFSSPLKKNGPNSNAKGRATTTKS